MPRRKLPQAEKAPIASKPARKPRQVTQRWLSRQLVEAHARARLEGDVRLELAALNALAKLHGLNREADMPGASPGESLTIYLPDNARD
jgi:hypothetical protein